MGMSTVAKIFLFALLCQCSHPRMNPSPRNSNATSSDERALLSFKSLLLSAQSGLLASWNTFSHFCGWPGVYCDRRHPERVWHCAYISAFNLSGRLSPSLGNLSFLRELFETTSSWERYLSNLIVSAGFSFLTLALTFSCPTEISGCTNLNSLELSNSHLQGEIPASLGTMENLFILDLKKNGLSGEIPQSLAGLPSIGLLFLYDNMLVGEIPPALGNLSSLLHLDLMKNMLSRVPFLHLWAAYPVYPGSALLTITWAAHYPILIGTSPC